MRGMDGGERRHVFQKFPFPSTFNIIFVDGWHEEGVNQKGHNFSS